MKYQLHIACISLLLMLIGGCEKDESPKLSALDEIAQTTYYSSEIFTGNELKLYGSWQLYAVSGGFAGTGHDLNFDFLEFKKYGIYGFVRNDSLLEHGKLVRLSNNLIMHTLMIEFENDEQSDIIFRDKLKYVAFEGNDTLHLNSLCCDRFNYHFKRNR